MRLLSSHHPALMSLYEVSSYFLGRFDRYAITYLPAHVLCSSFFLLLSMLTEKASQCTTCTIMPPVILSRSFRERLFCF